MDDAIFSFCRSLSSFCNHVESSSKALSDSVRRRSIPLGTPFIFPIVFYSATLISILNSISITDPKNFPRCPDSAAAAFLKSLERRTHNMSSDLNLLHSMAFDTVSFEELLGHCNEVYKANDRHVSQIEERMRSFGYVPDKGLVDEHGADVRLSSTSMSFRSSTEQLEDDALFDSISLKNLGLSDASLAALASEDHACYASTKLASEEIKRYGDSKNSQYSIFNEYAVDSSNLTGASYEDGLKIGKDDYDKLPAFMKKLSSWEELHEAVDKINSYISGKDRFNGKYTFDQGVLEMLGLGSKGRSYLLMLLRMNRLSAETVDGTILYRFSCNSP